MHTNASIRTVQAVEVALQNHSLVRSWEAEASFLNYSHWPSQVIDPLPASYNITFKNQKKLQLCTLPKNVDVLKSAV